MLHSTCMFCSIQFIFISTNLSIHWRIMCDWFCREPHQFTEILIINVNENTSVMHGNIDKLLLNATAVSDFKKLYRKSKPCNNLRTELKEPTTQKYIAILCSQQKSEITLEIFTYLWWSSSEWTPRNLSSTLNVWFVL